VRPTGVVTPNRIDAHADWIGYENKQLPCALDHFTRMITNTPAASLVHYLDDARAQLTATPLTSASAPLTQLAKGLQGIKVLLPCKPLTDHFRVQFEAASSRGCCKRVGAVQGGVRRRSHSGSGVARPVAEGRLRSSPADAARPSRHCSPPAPRERIASSRPRAAHSATRHPQAVGRDTDTARAERQQRRPTFL
jgi:hypothetical protein